MNLCIIPARGGSKRVPRKNIRPFAGKPLIAYSIAAAHRSKLFTRVVVSTEDDEIAQVARDHGAEVPFMRPASLADDHTTTIALMKHMARWALDEHPSCERLCCLYATAPCVRVSDLSLGLDRLVASAAAHYLYSITEHTFPVQRSLRLSPDEFVAPWMPEHIWSRSQDLEPLYHDAAQFYWGRATSWAKQEPFFGPSSLGFLLPRHRVVDIDTEADWQRAELQFQLLQRLEPSDAGGLNPPPRTT